MLIRLSIAAILAAAPAAMLIGASAPAAVTCTKVAAPTGSDSAAGTKAAPFKTAQKLVDSLSAGQTGCLRAGRHRLARGTRRVSRARTITLRPRIARRKLRRLRGSRMRLVIRTVGAGVS